MAAALAADHLCVVLQNTLSPVQDVRRNGKREANRNGRRGIGEI